MDVETLYIMFLHHLFSAVSHKIGIRTYKRLLIDVIVEFYSGFVCVF